MPVLKLNSLSREEHSCHQHSLPLVYQAVRTPQNCHYSSREILLTVSALYCTRSSVTDVRRCLARLVTPDFAGKLQIPSFSVKYLS